MPGKKVMAALFLVSVQNANKKRAAITFFSWHNEYKVFSNAIISTSFIPIGVNYQTYLETRRINVTHWKNQMSTKLHVKVVK
jgi:hypothetical protein